MVEEHFAGGSKISEAWGGAPIYCLANFSSRTARIRMKESLNKWTNEVLFTSLVQGFPLKMSLHIQNKKQLIMEKSSVKLYVFLSHKNKKG